MTATFTGSNGADPVAEFRLDVQSVRPLRSDLLLAGQLMIAAIRDRTFAGIDVEGGSFAPYSPAYAKRKSGALGHGRVDLFGADHHTHMLNALQTIVNSIEPFKESFSVGIYSNDELETRARVHNEGATIRTRLGTGKHGKTRLRFHPETFGYKGKASLNMPRRHWLGANAADVAMIENAVGARIDQRKRT